MFLFVCAKRVGALADAVSTRRETFGWKLVQSFSPSSSAERRRRHVGGANLMRKILPKKYVQQFLSRISEGESSPTCGIKKRENNKINRPTGMRPSAAELQHPAVSHLRQLTAVGDKD